MSLLETRAPVSFLSYRARNSSESPLLKRLRLAAGELFTFTFGSLPIKQPKLGRSQTLLDPIIKKFLKGAEGKRTSQSGSLNLRDIFTSPSNVESIDSTLKKIQHYWSLGSGMSNLSFLTSRGEKNRTSMVTVTDRNIGFVLYTWITSLLHWNHLSVNKELLKAIASIANYLASYMSSQGMLKTIKLLKCSLFAVNNFLAGNRSTNCRLIGTDIRMTNGLPKWLPHIVRMTIRSRSLPWIRTWVSCLNIYKGIYADHPAPNFSSIAAMPFEGDLRTYRFFAQDFWTYLSSLGMPQFDIEQFGKVFSKKAITRSSPQGTHSMSDAHASARVWNLQGDDNELTRWLSITGQSKLLEYYNYFASNPSPKEQTAIDKGLNLLPFKDMRFVTNYLGQLSTKLEPAGKVRVFAIVDWWTQKSLQNVHDWMFSVLRFLPGDSTFDQNQAVRSFVSQQHKSYWSFDLTSATDVIPQGLYRLLFTPIWSEEVVNAWLHLLTDRKYVAPQPFTSKSKPGQGGVTYKEVSENFNKNVENNWILEHKLEHFRPLDENIPGRSSDDLFGTYKYTRGQPMGALSSWAGLALVHHFVVYCAARRATTSESDLYRLMTQYRLLGDDISQANQLLAHEYLEVCRDVGILINPHKSIISVASEESDNPNSGGMVEFANQIVLKGSDISPLSLREELAISSWSARFEFVRRIQWRGWLLPIKEVGLTASNELVSLASLLRTLLHPKEWVKLASQYLTKGILPLEQRLLMLSLLAPSLLLDPTTKWYKYNDLPEPNRLALRTLIALTSKGNPLALMGGKGDDELDVYRAFMIRTIEWSIDHLIGKIVDTKKYFVELYHLCEDMRPRGLPRDTPLSPTLLALLHEKKLAKESITRFLGKICLVSEDPSTIFFSIIRIVFINKVDLFDYLYNGKEKKITLLALFKLYTCLYELTQSLTGYCDPKLLLVTDRSDPEVAIDKICKSLAAAWIKIPMDEAFSKTPDRLVDLSKFVTNGIITLRSVGKFTPGYGDFLMSTVQKPFPFERYGENWEVLETKTPVVDVYDSFREVLHEYIQKTPDSLAVHKFVTEFGNPNEPEKAPTVQDLKNLVEELKLETAARQRELEVASLKEKLLNRKIEELENAHKAQFDSSTNTTTGLPASDYEEKTPLDEFPDNPPTLDDVCRLFNPEHQPGDRMPLDVAIKFLAPGADPWTIYVERKRELELLSKPKSTINFVLVDENPINFVLIDSDPTSTEIFSDPIPTENNVMFDQFGFSFKMIPEGACLYKKEASEEDVKHSIKRCAEISKTDCWDPGTMILTSGNEFIVTSPNSVHRDRNILPKEHPSRNRVAQRSEV